MSKNAKALLLSVIGGVALMGMAIPAHAVIKVTAVTWLGQPAWKIEGAANGTFYFESGVPVGSTGFSSAIDQEGKDWILNDGAKKSGEVHEYRGFPNFGNDDFNHPQRPNKQKATSKWKDDKMEGESLVMETSNANFKLEYYFFASHIAIKVIEAKAVYSFLFEGPVGGKHEPGVDWSVGESDLEPGKQRAIENLKPNGMMNAAYPNKSFGKFFYLGDPVAKQVFFVAKTPDTAEADEGWGQKQNMSIFSFGRGGDVRKLTGTANICTFGFLNKADGYAKIKPFIEGTLANPFVAAGGGTTPPGTGGASGSGDGGVVATGGTTGSSDAAAMGGATSSGGATGSGGSSTTSGGTTTSSGGSTTTTSGGIAAKGGATASSGGTMASSGGKTTATGGTKATGGSTGTKTSGDSGGCSFGSSSGGFAGFGMAMFALGMLMLRRRRSSK